MNSDTSQAQQPKLLEGRKKSITWQIRAIHEEIEEAMAAGVSRATILELLEQRGLGKIKFNTFYSALQRIRTEKKRKGLVKQSLGQSNSAPNSGPFKASPRSAAPKIAERVVNQPDRPRGLMAELGYDPHRDIDTLFSE